MELSTILQAVGIILGLIYLWLEYKANIWVWVVGSIMPLVHGTLYLTKGIYADAAMQLYYVLAGIYGLAVWLRKPSAKSEDKHEGMIRHTPIGWIVPLVSVYVALHAALYFILAEFTDSTVPFFDSMSTALCIVAMWMLSRKLVEQWLVWLVVDMISVGLYFYKGIPGTACLYTLYCILAVAGYMRWRKQARIY
ncbi:MAG: nicotinamide mononucleotide transporter [Alistipes sp.]|nr:nicotinamide mononucleotide transporter [Alistipes sp.]